MPQWLDDDLIEEAEGRMARSLQDEYDDEELGRSLDYPIVVCYKFVPVQGLHSFADSFGAKDAVRYFEVMKQMAGRSFNEAIDDDSGIPNLHMAHINQKLRAALSRHNGGVRIGNINVFQFGLYTDKARRAGREGGVKAPRVFCMLGYNGVVYPLLYDPYHEMYKC